MSLITRAFVGHIRGGLAQTAIVGNVFLSGISGSSVADCAATSRVFVPQLTEAGYGRGFAAAVCAGFPKMLRSVVPDSTRRFAMRCGRLRLLIDYWAIRLPHLIVEQFASHSARNGSRDCGYFGDRGRCSALWLDLGC